MQVQRTGHRPGPLRDQHRGAVHQRPGHRGLRARQRHLARAGRGRRRATPSRRAAWRRPSRPPCRGRSCRGDEVVLDGFATAEGWMDKLYPWETSIDVSGPRAGRLHLRRPHRRPVRRRGGCRAARGHQGLHPPLTGQFRTPQHLADRAVPYPEITTGDSRPATPGCDPAMRPPRAAARPADCTSQHVGAARSAPPSTTELPARHLPARRKRPVGCCQRQRSVRDSSAATATTPAVDVRSTSSPRRTVRAPADSRAASSSGAMPPSGPTTTTIRPGGRHVDRGQRRRRVLVQHHGQVGLRDQRRAPPSVDASGDDRRQPRAAGLLAGLAGGGLPLRVRLGGALALPHGHATGRPPTGTITSTPDLGRAPRRRARRGRPWAAPGPR